MVTNYSVFDKSELDVVMSLKADKVEVDRLGDLIKSVSDRVSKLEAKETPTALYFPWYSREMRLKAVEIAQANPNVSFLFTVNPNSGPGTTVRTDIQDNINVIRQANKNVKILGYVYTKYGIRPPVEVKADVDKYVELYSGLDGIMWDEASSDLSMLAYYTDITNYARSKGLTYIRGNPGTVVPEQYIQLFDVTSINENTELISESSLKARTFNGKYPKEKFNYIAHTQTTLNEAWFIMAKKYVGSIYLTDRTEAQNPYSVPAASLNRQLELLQA